MHLFYTPLYLFEHFVQDPLISVLSTPYIFGFSEDMTRRFSDGTTVALKTEQQTIRTF